MFWTHSAAEGLFDCIARRSEGEEAGAPIGGKAERRGEAAPVEKKEGREGVSRTFFGGTGGAGEEGRGGVAGVMKAARAWRTTSEWRSS